jgi:PAS domain-containing protein
MPVLDREEYIEQAYFFQAFRERLADGQPAQDILARVGEELLSTTRMPLAVSFLFSEIKANGVMAPAMRRISHYFTPFQTHVVAQAELDLSRFAMDQALLILEREARYKAREPSVPGLFVFQFEALARNRLGYTKGLEAMATDPFYDDDWRDYIFTLQTRLGDVDFADLIYVRSAFFVTERRRLNPDYQPKFPSLFGEKEGKIARANRGRDPLYLFSALQRQLGYPEVPRFRRPDEAEARIGLLEVRVAQLENRIKALEGEVASGDVDLTQFIVKPEDTAGPPAGWGVHDLDE